MNDEKTIQAIRMRNEKVIGEVITVYSRLLWSVAGAVLNNIGSVQDMEECVADTFIYLWEHPEKYNPSRGKLKTWLSIIARTQAVNRCREITKRNTVSLEDTNLPDCLGIVEGILRKEAKETLLAAVNALGEPDREILLRFYQNACFGQIIAWLSEGMREDLRPQLRRLCQLGGQTTAELLRQAAQERAAK